MYPIGQGKLIEEGENAMAGPMTDIQIEQAVEVYRTLLREHRAELGTDVMQQLLAEPAYATAQAGVLRRCVRAIEKLIVFPGVSVDGSRTPEEATNQAMRNWIGNIRCAYWCPPVHMRSPT